MAKDEKRLEKEYPLVSIAIITYNQKEYLRECIESCLAQDYPNFEIVVADDCSTDGTQDLLREYETKYPGKFVLRLAEKNQGITGNSNLCIDACTGEYIALTGGDDVFYSSKVSRQVEVFEKMRGVAICGTYTHHINEKGERIGEQRDFKTRKNPIYTQCELIESNNGLVPVVSYMIKASAIPPERFDFRLPVASDSLFYFRVAEKGNIYIVKEFLTGYRVHESHARKIGYRDDSFVSRALAEYYYPDCLDAIFSSKSAMYYSLGRLYVKSADFQKASSFLRKSLKYKFKTKTLIALGLSVMNIKK